MTKEKTAGFGVGCWSAGRLEIVDRGGRVCYNALCVFWVLFFLFLKGAMDASFGFCFGVGFFGFVRVRK